MPTNRLAKKRMLHFKFAKARNVLYATIIFNEIKKAS